MKGKRTVERLWSQYRTRTLSLLELVHTDVMGYMKIKSKGDAKYVLTFVDEHSRYEVAYFLKAKTELLMKFNEFKKLHQMQGNSRVKCLRSKNVSDFVNKAMDKILYD